MTEQQRVLRKEHLVGSYRYKRRYSWRTSNMMLISMWMVCIVTAVLSCCNNCHAFAPQLQRSHVVIPGNTKSVLMPRPITTAETRLFRTSVAPLHSRGTELEWNSNGISRFSIMRQTLSSVRRYFRNIKGRLLPLLHRTTLLHQIRRFIFIVTLVFMVSFHTFIDVTNAAVSGGRVGGGSFKSSSSSGRVSTMSRPSMSSPRVYAPYPRTPIIINSFSGSRGWYAPTHESALIMSRVSTKDIILVTGTGMLLAYGYRSNRNRENNNGADGLLGSGYTVGSMTVSIDVPDRSSSDNILHKLNQLAMSADTMTKRGLQDLLSSVTLELLRQEQSITSAYTQSKSYPIMGQAEREFQVLSVASQSKVDRLTGTFRG